MWSQLSHRDLWKQDLMLYTARRDLLFDRSQYWIFSYIYFLTWNQSPACASAVTDRFISSAEGLRYSFKRQRCCRLHLTRRLLCKSSLRSIPCGLHTDSSIRIAIALRARRTYLFLSHTCVRRAAVDNSGRPGINCRMSAGRLSRHSAAVNDLLKRALQSAEIPSRLEPWSACSTTRCQAAWWYDTSSVVVRQMFSVGIHLCGTSCTLIGSKSPCHLNSAVTGRCAVANEFEDEIKNKCCWCFTSSFHCVPVTIHTLWGRMERRRRAS